MIWLADSRVEWLAPYQADIPRLRFTGPPGDGDHLTFETFGLVTSSWRPLLPCGSCTWLYRIVSVPVAQHGVARATENVPGKISGAFQVGLDTGLLLTGHQLEMVCTWEWQQGGRVIDMDDFDYELRFMIQNYTWVRLTRACKD